MRHLAGNSSVVPANTHHPVDSNAGYLGITGLLVVQGALWKVNKQIDGCIGRQIDENKGNFMSEKKVRKENEGKKFTIRWTKKIRLG